MNQCSMLPSLLKTVYHKTTVLATRQLHIFTKTIISFSKKMFFENTLQKIPAATYANREGRVLYLNFEFY